MGLHFYQSPTGECVREETRVWRGYRPMGPSTTSGTAAMASVRAARICGQQRLRWQSSRHGSLSIRGALLSALLLVPFSATCAAAADILEAFSLYRTGKYAECAELADKGIQEGQFSENWPLVKLKAEMAIGRYENALKTLDAALERFRYSIALRWYGRDVCRYSGQAERAELLTREIGELGRQAIWRYRDAPNLIILGRYSLVEGTDPKKVLDALYNEIKKQQPKFAEAFLSSGQLALEKHDYQLAAEEFQQAVKLDPEEPAGHYGLARAFAPSDSERAEAAITKALALNPNHVDSLLVLVDSHVDAERYDEARKLLSRIEKINARDVRAAAYRAVLAHLDNKPKEEEFYRKLALEHWSTNPEIDHLIGRKLSQKYRFAEGATYQRKALDIDGNYLPAKIQLAQDLLRLGDEDEGWRLAEAVFEKDGYNVVAHNLVTLAENLTKFRSLEEDGFIVRMDEREAEIYGARVLNLLKRARSTLAAKYEVTIDKPVVVEMFPRQPDFAIRTFGLPGGAGFLGVCFGRVITANSPASQGENPSNWEATLWHEFCHVVTLHKTNNKMPRWLSEGISVYEERLADPTWGQSINPQYRQMMLGEELPPVSQLSGAFLEPKTPLHLQFAYFESSLVVEYLVEKYGLDMLRRVLVDLGAGMPINDSLNRYTGSLAALDKEFAEFARQRAEAMAPEADWETPELPRRATSDVLQKFVQEHPNNYPALSRLAQQLIAEKKWTEAKQPLEQMRKLYPADSSDGNPLKLLAAVHRELEETDEERAALEKLAALSADDLEAFERLAELASTAGDHQATIKHARRMLAVNPLQRTPHRLLAAAATAANDGLSAIEAYQALLKLEPIDPAEIHYQLATLLADRGELTKAKRHVLEALEEAPRYRAAHQRLLTIVKRMDDKEKKHAAVVTPQTQSPDTMPPASDDAAKKKEAAEKEDVEETDADQPQSSQRAQGME
jgi:tetratricopeptide (TPR) repeat protein